MTLKLNNNVTTMTAQTFKELEWIIKNKINCMKFTIGGERESMQWGYGQIYGFSVRHFNEECCDKAGFPGIKTEYYTDPIFGLLAQPPYEEYENCWGHPAGNNSLCVVAGYEDHSEDFGVGVDSLFGAIPGAPSNLVASYGVKDTLYPFNVNEFERLPIGTTIDAAAIKIQVGTYTHYKSVVTPYVDSGVLVYSEDYTESTTSPCRVVLIGIPVTGAPVVLGSALVGNRVWSDFTECANAYLAAIATTTQWRKFALTLSPPNIEVELQEGGTGIYDYVRDACWKIGGVTRWTDPNEPCRFIDYFETASCEGIKFSGFLVMDGIFKFSMPDVTAPLGRIIKPVCGQFPNLADPVGEEI